MTRRSFQAAIAAAALALAAAVGHAAPPPAADAPAVLRRAESAYDRGIAALAADPAGAKAAFTESAAAYRELAEVRRIRNAAVLANLGNAYLLSGDTGRAVLSFRRAERIGPNYPAARAGLGLARSQVGTAVEPGSADRAAAWLTAWRRAVTPRALLTTGAAVWGAGWLALAVATLRPGTRRIGPLCAVVVGGLCIALVLADDAARRQSRDAVLIADAVVGRNGPGGEAYAPSFDKPLAAGVELTIVEERGDWVRARLTDGRETWLPQSAVERI